MSPTLTVVAGASAILFGLLLSALHLSHAQLRPQPRPLPRIDLPENVARRFIERLIERDVSELVEPGVALSARWSPRLDAWMLVVDGGAPRIYSHPEIALDILERDVVAHIRDGRRKEHRSAAENLERDWRGGR